jgi:tetratricopeptide (TPR) repeat protein
MKHSCIYIYHQQGSGSGMSKSRLLLGRRIIALLFCLLPLAMYGVTKRNADTEYLRGNYQQAIADYRDLLSRGISADLYYNLGNAYYRTDSLAEAILFYERALQLEPGDADIRFNLQFARSKTIDKITPESEMFFVTWYHALVNLTGVDQWAVTAIVSIVLALVLMLFYLFAPSLSVRKGSFYGSIALLIVFLLSNLFAWQQKQMLEERHGAIVMVPTVNVKKTPVKDAADAFVLHEGTRVDITDKSMKGWIGFRLADGREGWITSRSIEEI